MHRRKRAGYGDHMTGRLSEAFAAAADFLSRQDPRADPPEHVGRLLAATGLDRDIGGEDGTRRSDTIGLLRAAARFGGVFRLRSRAAPGMAFFGGFAAPDPARSDAESLRVSLSGAGITPSEAFRACIGEGIEYVAQFETHRLRTGNARDAEAWNRRTYPPELFEWTGQVDGIDWVEAECLSDGESFWIPAPLAMRSASPPSEVDARRWAVGNGCAAGPTAAAARCAALYETIERDAVALWWRGGRPPLEVSQPELDALGATELLAVVRQGQADYETTVLQIPCDFGLTCLAAFSFDHEGGFAGGYACHPDPQRACRSAIREMCQMELGNEIIAARQDSSGSAAPAADAPGRERRDLVTPDAPAFRPAGPSSLALQGVPAFGEVVARLAEAGFQAYAVDFIEPASEIPVAKIVVPGLQPYPSSFVTRRLVASMTEYTDSAYAPHIDLF